MGRRILGVLVGGIGVDLILGLAVATVGTIIVAVLFRGDAVICQPTTAQLTCTEVAATYIAAAAPASAFSAQVQGTGQQCQAFFDAAGNELEALE